MTRELRNQHLSEVLEALSMYVHEGGEIGLHSSDGADGQLVITLTVGDRQHYFSTLNSRMNETPPPADEGEGRRDGSLCAGPPQ